MKENRKKCVLCDGILKDIFSFHMPLFMGVNKCVTNELSDTMSFCKCGECGLVHIKEIIDLEILYQNNHNVSIVGKIWQNHYEEFSSFIKNDIDNKIVLEISDPSAKIAKLSKNFNHWYIIEPNPEKIYIEGVSFIKGFFEPSFNSVTDADVIVHSHLLEHMFNPIEFMTTCHRLLNVGGKMIFSIPDMESILNNGNSVNNVLHFEHTFYINHDVIKFLCSKVGFEILDKYNYNNHSIFYKLKKIEKTSEFNLKLEVSDLFKNSYENHNMKIKNINEKIESLDNDFSVFLFGGHVSSQYYLTSLNSKKIKSIIDNDPNKQGFKLYGSDLYIKSPDVISGIDKCVVICSHVGIYKDEIINQLMNLNPKTILL